MEDHLAHRSSEERAILVNEMRELEDTVAGLDEDYQLVDRLGEGTFSSVYKAIDLHHVHYDNTLWLPAEASSEETTTRASNKKTRKVYVALKRIYVTSSPARIENEISILEDLKGCSNISQLITAFRFEDQIIVVMPFHCNDDFRNYYRYMNIDLLQRYFRDLFRALRATHARGIIHRDVKPANFLYDVRTGTGVLVDYGLAQRYQGELRQTPKCQHSAASFEYPHGKRIRTDSTKVVEQAIYEVRKRAKLPADRIGFPAEDRRPSAKANRAGTRGFRAPEVLFKCPDQSVAIDIWSAGIILLSFLTRKFPIFNSSDDTEALMEISAIFGKLKMDKCGALHNRTFISNLPSIDHPGHPLESIILAANPDFYNSDEPNYRADIMLALDLLKRCLALDPCKRITANEALYHPFLAQNDVDEDEDAPRNPLKGICRRSHIYDDEKGQHHVIVKGAIHEVGYGEGIAFGSKRQCS
ncbi:kinase-like protein [Phaffia rhodozyma]|uniref:non-specific serine/threonine protein kinase n=1 Tax=Phaffia rhodozyma TaxID=264483 RepID=A0A0F7SMN3_PHARH|nr:kinase-like protein [Phaffia rhodozyma]